MFDFSYFPQLETERLLLRKLTHDDAAAIVEEFSHPDVMEHLDADPPLDTLEGAIGFINWSYEWFDNKSGWRWGVVLKAENKLIGTAGFHRWSHSDFRAEIGYDYNRKYWGNGYATEVVRRMIQFGFEEMNLNRIEADCNEGNFGSARVLEKAGFIYEGLWRERIWEKGKFVGLKQFGYLARDYHNSKGA